jgi:succinate-semialdehyde dehydrogenase/glutarate-semialdehyde dehydrogenase
MSIATINPATGETVQTFAPHDADEIERRIARAVATFHGYRRTTLDQRAGWLNAAAAILDEDRERWARIITIEMGKLIQSARDEVAKCAAGCRYYSSHAADFLREERVELKTGEGIVRYEPIGPVLAIMPWNFPFWQVIRFAAPAFDGRECRLIETRFQRSAVCPGAGGDFPPGRISRRSTADAICSGRGDGTDHCR